MKSRNREKTHTHTAFASSRRGQCVLRRHVNSKRASTRIKSRDRTYHGIIGMTTVDRAHRKCPHTPKIDAHGVAPRRSTTHIYPLARAAALRRGHAHSRATAHASSQRHAPRTLPAPSSVEKLETRSAGRHALGLGVTQRSDARQLLTLEQLQRGA